MRLIDCGSYSTSIFNNRQSTINNQQSTTDNQPTREHGVVLERSNSSNKDEKEEQQCALLLVGRRPTREWHARDSIRDEKLSQMHTYKEEQHQHRQ
jgi:hypothetical protein